MRRRMRGLMRKAVLLVSLAMIPAVAFGQFFQSPIKPSVTVSEPKGVPAGSTFDVIADFQLDTGVHLYRDKMSFRWEKLDGAAHVADVFPEARKVPDLFGPDKNATIEVYAESVRLVARMRSTGKEGDPITVRGELGFQACTDEACYPPGTEPIEFDLTTVAALPEGRRGVIWLILIAFAAGIGISLTPCVYPMIPIMAAIVGGTKQKGKLGALLSSMLYVLGLSITYSLLGLLVASGGARVRTALASPWVLVPIAGVFVLFALSMFEVISIQVQPKFVNKWQSSLSGKGHIVTVFLLGIISGLVAGPCISAPLAAVLVDIARQGDKLLGFLRLFALAWGMGIILIVAGTFTGALPQAGEWTLWVKKLFGFVMLWAAAYFLSSVIGGTAYRAATAIVLIAAAVFLGGFDTLTKESGFADRMKRFIGLVAVLAAAYLFIGGFVKTDRPAPVAAFREGRYEKAEGDRTSPTGAFREGSYEDVEEAIGSGQPVVLDFYADWCKYCKELDARTFSHPQVVTALQGFRALKVDIEKEPRLEEKYKILGVPTIVFIGPDGKELEKLRLFGFKSAEEFLEILKQVK